MESAGQGESVGEPVVATDLNNHALTYTLDDPNGKFTINSRTGQITVTANDSLDHEVEPDYSIEVTATDTAGLEDTIEVKVIITGVNDPPVISGADSAEFNENATGRVGRYTATDPEADDIEWSVSGTGEGFFSIDQSGYLTFRDPPDHEASRGNIYNVAVVATDDGVPRLADSLAVEVTVTDVNEAPEIVAGSGVITYSENGTHPVEPYGAHDPEGDTPITWSLSGADKGDFSITNTGLLQFRKTPDYERPADSGGNNVYNVTVRASDGSLTGAKDVTVTVQNVNEAPIITGDATLSYPENTATTQGARPLHCHRPREGPVDLVTERRGCR